MFVSHIRHTIRPRHIFALEHNYLRQRKFSLISVHTKFPASLYRFQVERKSALFEYKHGGDDVVDALKIAADGLVYPRISSNDIPPSNGAVFMPNTFGMQEMMRMEFDYYMDDLKDGQSELDTTILRIHKGTVTPWMTIVKKPHLTKVSI
ncbi:MAG: hypothetical protein Q9172_001884 [Xanthocarpia lactea]